MEKNINTQKHQDEEIHPKMYLYRRIVLAKAFIDTNYQKPLDLNVISDTACLSKYHFLRQFKLAYGLSPHKYLTKVRIQEARKCLKEGQPVTHVCFTVGFESVPSFTHLFKKQTGMSPSRYAQWHKRQKDTIDAKPLASVPSCFADQFLK